MWNSTKANVKTDEFVYPLSTNVETETNSSSDRSVDKVAQASALELIRNKLLNLSKYIVRLMTTRRKR